MKITFLGDSITVGIYFESNESGELVGKKACPNYADIICSEFKVDRVESLAQSGTSYSSATNTFPEDSIVRKSRRVGNSDVVIISAGTNDLTTKVKLGKIQDKKGNSFYGAVDKTLRTIKKKKIEKIIVISPLHRENEVNEMGYSLTDICKAIMEKCKKYNIPVINGFNIPFDLRKEEDRKMYGNDGLHPNEKAHKLYAEYVIKEIKTRKLI